MSESARAGLQTLVLFAGIAWIIASGLTTYRSLEDDVVRWPFVWSIVLTLILAASILGLVVL